MPFNTHLHAAFAFSPCLWKDLIPLSGSASKDREFVILLPPQASDQICWVKSHLFRSVSHQLASLRHQQNISQYQPVRGTQELKILASVIVDRLKWWMHVEGCCSRNRNDSWKDCRRPTISSTFVSQGVCKWWRWYLSHCVPGTDTDKELLIDR